VTDRDVTDLRDDDLERELATYLDALADDLRARAPRPDRSAEPTVRTPGVAPDVETDQIVTLETYTSDRARRADAGAGQGREPRHRRAVWLVAAAVLLIGAIAAVAVRAARDDSDSLPLVVDPDTEECGGGALAGSAIVGDLCVGTFEPLTDGDSRALFITSLDGGRVEGGWVEAGCVTGTMVGGEKSEEDGERARREWGLTSPSVATVRYLDAGVVVDAPTVAIPGVSGARFFAAHPPFDAPNPVYLDAQGSPVGDPWPMACNPSVAVSPDLTARAIRASIAATSEARGAVVGGPCPDPIDASDGTRALPAMGIVVGGEPGRCVVVAWVSVGPLVPPGYYDQEGNFLGPMGGPYVPPTPEVTYGPPTPVE
jgi:hypothetical protein